MHVPASAIDAHLPASQQDRRLTLLAPDGRNAFSDISTNEALHLAAKSLVTGEVNKHGYLKFLRSPHIPTIARELHNMRRPLLSASTISHTHQQPGATRWIVRLDRARSGSMGSRRSVFLSSQPAPRAMRATA